MKHTRSGPCHEKNTYLQLWKIVMNFFFLSYTRYCPLHHLLIGKHGPHAPLILGRVRVQSCFKQSVCWGDNECAIFGMQIGVDRHTERLWNFSAFMISWKYKWCPRFWRHVRDNCTTHLERYTRLSSRGGGKFQDSLHAHITSTHENIHDIDAHSKFFPRANGVLPTYWYSIYVPKSALVVEVRY